MSEFFAMGGYGLYVWGSYGVTAIALVAEIILLRHRRRTLLRRAGRRNRSLSMGVGHETQA